MSELLLVEEKDHTISITFNRPDKANAMNNALLEELLDLVNKIGTRTDLKFVIFKGNGKHFSGGADLTEMVGQIKRRELTADKGRYIQKFGLELMSKIEQLEQVTFASIQGACIGGALALALACDFRFADETTYFGIPEIYRGTFYTWGSTARLINTIGVTKAKEMIILAQNVGANRAAEINLITEVTDSPLLTIQKHIDNISNVPYTPIRVTKKLAYAAGIAQYHQLTAFDGELFEQALLIGDPQEEMTKFVNKK